MNQNVKTMTPKKHAGSLLMKINCSNENSTVIFQKKLTCVSLWHRDFKKHLLIKISIKILSKYIFRQLK